MKWLEYDVTLEEAYEQVKAGSFGLWKTSGNYMKIDDLVEGQSLETLVFMGEAIFIIGLSVENKGFNVMASLVDFVDIWHFVKAKYPELFQEGVRGSLCLLS